MSLSSAPPATEIAALPPGKNKDSLTKAVNDLTGVRACACACVCVRVYVRACVSVRVRLVRYAMCGVRCTVYGVRCGVVWCGVVWCGVVCACMSCKRAAVRCALSVQVALGSPSTPEFSLLCRCISTKGIELPGITLRDANLESDFDAGAFAAALKASTGLRALTCVGGGGVRGGLWVRVVRAYGWWRLCQG